MGRVHGEQKGETTMTRTKERARNSDYNLDYRVVATAHGHVLPQLREVLAAIHPLSVILSPAVSWNDQGQEVVYRGARWRPDREIVRVEIACSERHVDWLLRAVRRVLANGGSATHDGGLVAAFRAELCPGNEPASGRAEERVPASTDGARVSSYP
jgi:hypothetical protein